MTFTYPDQCILYRLSIIFKNLLRKCIISIFRFKPFLYLLKLNVILVGVHILMVKAYSL